MTVTMEKEMVFHILGISETRDSDLIKKAYMEHLKSANPEDDAEGFKRLRQAYETALAFAGKPEDEEEAEKPKTEIDNWIEKVNQLYQDLLSRADENQWREVLADPVCEELDTSFEAREKLMVYLLNHIRLPHNIWKILDNKFEILEDLEDLKQRFPADFLNYVSYYIQNPTFIPYEYFQFNGLDEESLNGDGYIDGYLKVKHQIDDGEIEGCLQILDDLKGFDLYHPYEDVERIRIYCETDRALDGANLAEKLLKDYPKDEYIRFYSGEAKWKAGDKEQAYDIWNHLLEECPDHYSAKLGVARCLMEKGDFYEAREMMLELLDKGRNEDVESMIRKANDSLIQEFKTTLSEGRDDERLPGHELQIKLGWCLFQNERMEEAVELLAGFKPEAEEEYLYYNLYGRVLYQIDRHEEALPFLQRWLELIKGLTDDGTAETKKRISRHGGACYILAGCYYALKRQNEAEEMLAEAVEAASTVRDRLEYKQYLANILLWSNQYEKSIDVCDQIIQEDENYFPAYLTRQESCYQLRKAQQVVNDYYKAIGIYPGYYKPYLFAAKVFFFYDQYEDAKGVIDRAKENQVEFSPELKLYQVKILRNLAKNRQDRDVPRQILEEIKNELDQENCDIEDKSEVNYEMGLLWWDDDEFDASLEALGLAIEGNPKRLQYRLIRGDVYLEMKRYEDALEEYKQAEPDYEGRPGIHYAKGLCQEGLGNMEKAVVHFKKAAELQNGYKDVNEKLSDYYKDRYEDYGRIEDYQMALSYINAQLQLKENCYYLICRGLIYDVAMEQELAIRDYEKAAEYSPDKWIVWNNMGCSYKYLKQYEKAIECCEKAISIMGEKKDRMPYRNLADCYKALGEKEKAIECYRKGLEITPDYAYFWEEIGDLYYEMNRFDEALEAYEHTKERNKHYSDIGDVWLKQGNAEKCIACYLEGIEKGEGSVKINRLSRLGSLYMEELWEFDKAVIYFKKAIKLETDPYELFDYERYLARAYYMLGQKKMAKKHALASLENFRKSGRDEENYLEFRGYAPARLASFGWIYLCIGDVEKAKQLFRKMDQIMRCKSCRFHGCYESFLYMGYVYLGQGQYKLALQQFQKAFQLNPESNEARCAVEKLDKRQKKDKIKGRKK
ncbi:MAG: tetratricopeptide repeat protein [Lachnospiraceae bacterium]|nr:tetratricopeptide repeat protein [Lachnospiraceae bacterium]